MFSHGLKGNPPDRPAMTHRNEPPALVAVNPSWEVVPGAPATTPPPRTAGPEEPAAEGASAISATPSKRGARNRPRAAAIGPPDIGGVAKRHGRVGFRTPLRQDGLSAVMAH